VADEDDGNSLVSLAYKHASFILSVLGGLIAAIVFLQRARGAGRPIGRPFDG